MVSYLQRVSLADMAAGAATAGHCAAHAPSNPVMAGSSVGLSAAAAPGGHKPDDDDSDSGSWETDSGSAMMDEQQPANEGVTCAAQPLPDTTGGLAALEVPKRRGVADRQLLISLRLERQGLTDAEAEMLSIWFARAAPKLRLGVAKLWLFNNVLGDAGATALAPLLGPHTAEVHLSHCPLYTFDAAHQ